ncbi:MULTISPECIES: hypothetical protein [Candidatus Nitrosocaldus]|jgi:ABC-type transport system involved in cytochrome c biogenesis permease component|uniref:Uncharacterized protein n=1 Tax=Candidatus Nitrosocaldus cavascurensis TaxID=2058097 RepID=A0A2K5ANQ9_9ARCH|nr:MULTISPECIES: hypothetical protein [Candidatus Nitrosocaldus]SPC33272.1 conserved protein of unknown function [Candidatus Nitrosocaldus cavascurensis]
MSTQQISAGRIMRRARQNNVDPGVLMKGAWVSTMLALIIVLPLAGVILAVNSLTGNIAIAAVAGFAIHAVTLAFIGRISDALTAMLE